MGVEAMMEHMRQAPASMAACPIMKSVDEKSMDVHKLHAK